jgi:hypothetical protein
MNINAILFGALAGLAGTIKTDLDAFKQAPKGSKFDWELAGRRWLAGAFTGALAGAGLGALPVSI